MSKHNLETIKVSQVLADFTLSKLLGNGSFSELGFNTAGNPELGKGLGTGTTGHGNLERGQLGVADEEGLTGDSGALDEDAVEVDDFEDASQLSSKFAFLQQNDAADFNETIEYLGGGGGKKRIEG